MLNAIHTHKKEEERKTILCPKSNNESMTRPAIFIYKQNSFLFSPHRFFFFLCFVVRFDSRQGIHNRPPSTTSPPLYNFVVLQLSKRRIYRRAAASFPSYIISSSYTSQKIGMRKKKKTLVFILFRFPFFLSPPQLFFFFYLIISFLPPKAPPSPSKMSHWSSFSFRLWLVKVKKKKYSGGNTLFPLCLF